MKLIERLLSAKKAKSPYRVRYSKSDQQWQVYRDARIVYLGDKLTCQNFIDHQQSMQTEFASN